MKKLALLLLMAVSFSAQPATHIVASGFVTDVLIKENIDPVVAYPLGGILSHFGADIMIGESNLGGFQLEVGGVRSLIMYFVTPEDKKTDFLLKAFWGLFPDIVDKALGTKIFHSDGRLASTWTQDGTNLLEDVAVLSYVVKF